MGMARSESSVGTSREAQARAGGGAFCLADAGGVLLYASPEAEAVLGAGLAGRRLSDLEPAAQGCNARLHSVDLRALLAPPGHYLVFVERADGGEPIGGLASVDWQEMIAHDLATLQSAVFAGVVGLDESLPKESLSATQVGMLQAMLRCCQRMTRLFASLLDMGRLDAGFAPPSLLNVSVSKLLLEVLEEHSPLIRSRRIDVDLRVLPSLVVRADPELLYRVLQNVVNNAVKYTPEAGSIVIAEHAGDEASGEVSVTDSGPGLSPQDLPLLFDRYYRAQAWKERRLTGTGLGLAFCREAMRSMRGEIRAVAAPGKGGEFILRLPRAQSGGAGRGEI